MTRSQFEEFAKAAKFKVVDKCIVWTGSELKKQSGSFIKPGFEQTGTHPVLCVSWDDAKAYIAWLSQKSGQTYRLLTEAEWEYAARAGTNGRWSFVGDEANVCEYANHADTGTSFSWRNAKCRDGAGERTAEVGLYKPNAFGLHDMHGNVGEWVEDCYQDSYKAAPVDATATTETSGCRRVVRGGSWFFSPEELRSADRGRNFASLRSYILGFRVGRTLGP
ncbi:MAG: formylglycine-generating enzyme family protein [Hyphomicrobium sp.]